MLKRELLNPKVNEVLDAVELRKVIHYDEESGVVTWRKKLGNRTKVGALVGSVNKHSGYIQVKIYGTQYQLHRLIWLYVYGQYPMGDIDHVNHVRADNRLVNIRDVTRVQNGRNQSLPSTNTSGVVGVYWHKTNKTWIAQIRVKDSGNIPLGSFAKFSEAVDARKLAEVAYGFHENHGKEKI